MVLTRSGNSSNKDIDFASRMISSERITKVRERSSRRIRAKISSPVSSDPSHSALRLPSPTGNLLSPMISDHRIAHSTGIGSPHGMTTRADKDCVEKHDIGLVDTVGYDGGPEETTSTWRTEVSAIVDYPYTKTTNACVTTIGAIEGPDKETSPEALMECARSWLSRFGSQGVILLDGPECRTAWNGIRTVPGEVRTPEGKVVRALKGLPEVPSGEYSRLEVNVVTALRFAMAYASRVNRPLTKVVNVEGVMDTPCLPTSTYEGVIQPYGSASQGSLLRCWGDYQHPTALPRGEERIRAPLTARLGEEGFCLVGPIHVVGQQGPRDMEYHGEIDQGALCAGRLVREWLQGLTVQVIHYGCCQKDTWLPSRSGRSRIRTGRDHAITVPGLGSRKAALSSYGSITSNLTSQGDVLANTTCGLEYGMAYPTDLEGDTVTRVSEALEGGRYHAYPDQRVLSGTLQLRKPLDFMLRSTGGSGRTIKVCLTSMGSSRAIKAANEERPHVCSAGSPGGVDRASFRSMVLIEAPCGLRVEVGIVEDPETVTTPLLPCPIEDVIPTVRCNSKGEQVVSKVNEPLTTGGNDSPFLKDSESYEAIEISGRNGEITSNVGGMPMVGTINMATYDTAAIPVTPNPKPLYCYTLSINKGTPKDPLPNSASAGYDLHDTILIPFGPELNNDILNSNGGSSSSCYDMERVDETPKDDRVPECKRVELPPKDTPKKDNLKGRRSVEDDYVSLEVSGDESTGRHKRDRCYKERSNSTKDYRSKSSTVSNTKTASKNGKELREEEGSSRRSRQTRSRRRGRRSPPPSDSSSSTSSASPRSSGRRRTRRPTSSNSSEGFSSDSGIEYRLTRGSHYRPHRRANGLRKICDGCQSRRCRNPMTSKEFDSAQQTAIKLKAEYKFRGNEDRRSGTMWLTEMEKKTEGHSEVVQYLWLKEHTEGDCWDTVVDGHYVPSRCYNSYSKNLSKVYRRFRKLYDTDEKLQRTLKSFETCKQGSESVYRYVKRLEKLSTELYYLGSPILEYTLKWKLYMGLSDKELRGKLDDYVSDSRVSFKALKKRVNEQAQRMYQISKMITDGDITPKERSRYRYRSTSRVREGSVHSIGSNVDSEAMDLYTEQYIMAIGRDTAAIKCYRCLKPGHSASRCTASEPADMDKRCIRCGSPAHKLDGCNVKVERAVCRRCNFPGHLAYTCRADAPVGSQGPGTPRAMGRNRANAPVHMVNARDDVITSCKVAATTTGHTPMVIGEVLLEGKPVAALFDTGAEVSLITVSTLRDYVPGAVLSYGEVPKVSVADGAPMSILGKVRLTIATASVAVTEWFIVTEDTMTVSVLLGCSTLARLNASINFTPTGVKIHTNPIPPVVESNPTGVKKVRFEDKVVYLPDERLSLSLLSNENLGIQQQVHKMNDLLRESDPSMATVSSISLEELMSPDSVWCSHRCEEGPEYDTKVSTLTTVFGGQGEQPPVYDSNGSNIVGSHKDTPLQEITDHSKEDPQRGQLHEEDSDDSVDNKPPWEVLQRQWLYDNKAVLGRVMVSTPWINEDRPEMNYRYAAKRGAHSVQRLTATQKEAFEKALDQYVSRGFCGVVKDNKDGDYGKPPTATECQRVWNLLTKGSGLQGTVVTLPRHFTPSHTVFRDNHVTTPCRIVLDFRELNRYCYKGGKAQSDLLGVLLHIRSFRHLIGSDVSKAFCQMTASLTDLPYTAYTCIGDYTVLWERISFGSTMAPNMLEASSYDVVDEIKGIVGCVPSHLEGVVDPKVLDRGQLAKVLLLPTEGAIDYIMNGPPIPTKMLFQRFVDDLFFGGNTMAMAESCRDFISYIFKGHGLCTDPAKDIVASFGGIPSTGDKASGHILGYLLAIDRDELHCIFSGSSPGQKVTKRQALAILSSLYDPLGLLLELDMQGRFLWHDICEGHKDWTDVIDDLLAQRLNQWVHDAQRISCELGTQRFMDLTERSLIVSTDASTDAWGVDVRLDGDFSGIRLMAKGGIFPATQSTWSIPRKELVGVHQGLKYIRMVSSHLPVRTILRPLQAPLLYLAPEFKPKKIQLLCDSEITIYRLRKEANDKKLPAPERRRLAEIRSMCKELNCVIKHIPSELNFADSITRARLDFGRQIVGAEVLAAMESSKVVYDYEELGDNKAENDEGKVLVLTTDGIDLPDVGHFPADEASELGSLMAYATPDGRYDGELLNDEGFEETVTVCVRRCQMVDGDVCQFRLYLVGDITKAQLGLKSTTLERLGRICYVDRDGLVHRRPSSMDESDRLYGKGVLYLGESDYSSCMVRILAVIYHYIYGHLGGPRVYGKLTLRFWRKGLKRLVKGTIGSCVSCLKARASRRLDYVTTHVQGLVSTGLWQVVGADLAGPYGKHSPDSGEVDHYLLLVHDHVSGFTCARVLRDSLPKTIALAFHSIFCEHGSPRVLLTDQDRVHFIRKDVKVVLAKHGVKYYTLPGYAQFLSFWERPHKDFVEVTKAIRSSRTSEEERESYVSDYLMAVRTYNTTPRLWANLSPAELHFTYGIRIPGERIGEGGEVDWDSLRMKYIDTDAIKFMRDNLLVLEDARKDAEVRMYEYLDPWRIRQEKNLERMAKANDRVYVPKLFDIVFTSKSPPHRIGHHLDTIWSGPHTVTALKGSSMVEVTNGIIFPGLGRVTVDEDENKVKVPDEYGQQEVFALKNIIHAAALQGVVYEYLERGSRVYLDVDGALKEFKLQDGDSDGKQVELARKKTELKMLAKKADKSEGLEPPMDGPLPPGITPEDEYAEDEGSVQLPPGIDPDSPVEEGSSDSSEDIGEEDEVKVDVQYVQEQLGYGQGLCFGKFLHHKPPKGSIVISIGEDYVGLAMVIDDDDGDDEKILIQPMKVELFGGCISVQKVNNEDLFNTDLSSVVYVSPGSHHWTRRRSKDLLQLLGDINGWGFRSSM